uniref:Uncharacterized protein n=1 Tax=Manihot esculenta TaxID=3983 RepID=A0A2C9US45_MANES
MRVYSGCSSCSGAGAPTGLYTFDVCRPRLQVNQIPEADNPTINIIMAKTTSK